MSLYAQYQHLAIEKPKPPPTPEEIQALEAALGVALPPEFLAYLSVANGGSLEYEIAIDLPNGTEILSFCTLFCTRPDQQTYDFIEELHQWRQNANIPNAVLPFAEDGGGSTVFLDLTPQGKGRVVAFIEGLPDWASPNQESHFLTIADSFTDYVQQLYIDRDRALEQAQNLKAAHHKNAMRDWLDIGLPEWREDPDFQKALG